MKLLNKILLAVDFTEDSKAVLETGKALHETFHSQLILVHVLPERVNKQEIGKLVDKAARDNIAHLKTQLSKEGIEEVETTIRYGSVFDQIIDTAEDWEVNAILAGSGGTKIKKEPYLGTSVEKVIRKTGIPVWLIRNDNISTPKKLLCPVDFSEPSKRALSNAIMLANKFNAELKVLSVNEPEISYSRWIKADLAEANKREHQSFLKQYDEFLNEFDFKNVKWEKIDKSGNVANEIIQYTKKENIDLLLIGTTGRTGLGRILMGGVTEKVLREVSCSVITTKSQSMMDFHFEMKISELSRHYKKGLEALEKNDLPNAQIHLELAHNQDPFHVPTLVNLSKLYDLLDKKRKANEYREEAKKVVSMLWDDKIAKEILKYYKL